MLNSNLANSNVRYNADYDKLQVKYNNQWINVFGPARAQTFYLYESGNEYTPRTGGWKLVSSEDGAQIRNDALGVYIENHTEFKTETYTINKVDLTGFNWLVFSVLDLTLTKLWNNKVGITSGNTGIILPNPSKQYDDAANNLVEGNLLKVDVSGYQGSYYIALYQTTGGSAKSGGCYFDKIWLE